MLYTFRVDVKFFNNKWINLLSKVLKSAPLIVISNSDCRERYEKVFNKTSYLVFFFYYVSLFYHLTSLLIRQGYGMTVTFTCTVLCWKRQKGSLMLIHPPSRAGHKATSSYSTLRPLFPAQSIYVWQHRFSNFRWEVDSFLNIRLNSVTSFTITK